jgi:tetratricopeptide (TPR) repeat protein
MGTPADSYLALARGAAGAPDMRRLAARDLAALPPLDENLLDELVSAAELAAHESPRLGWLTLLTAALAARSQSAPAELRAAIDLQLSRAASYWGHPRRAAWRARRAGAVYGALASGPGQARAAVALNLAPWTRPDFSAARRELEQALAVLEAAGPTDWHAEALHALAFAEMLTGALDPARAHLTASRQMLRDLGREIPALRVQLTEAGWLRRAGQPAESVEQLKRLEEEFRARRVLPDLARARYQLGMAEVLRGEDFPRAEQLLREAQAEFEALEMDLWAAQARSGQAQAAVHQGRLGLARAQRRLAIPVFARHGTLGLLADNLNDQALLEYYHGDLPAAVETIERARETYLRLGARPAAANAQINAGRFRLAQARYQSALAALEQARQELRGQDQPGLLGYCHLQLSYAWLGVGSPAEAQKALEAARRHYGQVRRAAPHTGLLQAMAQLALQQGSPREALGVLHEAVQAGAAAGDHAATLRARRLLGETLLAMDSLTAAREHFEQCHEQAGEHGQELEAAAALAAQADVDERLGAARPAARARARALALNRDILPEITARVQFGRARAAQARGRPGQALGCARAGVAALRQMRRDFWQPRLAGEYAARRQADLAWAVELAARRQDLAAALDGIECAKAQTLMQGALGRAARELPPNEDIQAARAEVTWLLEQLRAAPFSPLGGTPGAGS